MSRRIVPLGLLLCLALGDLHPPVELPRVALQANSRPRMHDDYIRLRNPKVIVLHFTGGNSYSSAWNWFASNSPSRGELPGVCAHFIVGRNGTIHRVVRMRVRCRHAIGLNYTAIGVEMVQATGEGSHWAAQRILHRRRQIRPTLRLVAWIKGRFGIRMRNIIGHAMANNSPYFRDLRGWQNDHTDWLWREVRIFRRRLRHHL